ncbi:hypothetical protein, partial [Geobacillus thermocatenulatus]|uniref:hypothetical protein n=1 Tax=Geobacillus thermocatenulatus TaxID=33938 RepID=UPI001C11B52C
NGGKPFSSPPTTFLLPTPLEIRKQRSFHNTDILREESSLYSDAACEHQFMNTGNEECRYDLIIHSPASKT